MKCALKERREDSRNREDWIVFDKDNHPNDFDKVISSAQKNQIHIGWSDPCIEIFFHAYYGKMPNDANPQTCISSFSNDYKEATKKEYLKNEKLIYSFLLKTGDEENALKISERTLNVSKESALKKKPSAYCPGSILHELVGKVVKHRPKKQGIL